MMKLLVTLSLISTVSAFTALPHLSQRVSQGLKAKNSDEIQSATRREVFGGMSVAFLAAASFPSPSLARGRSTQVASWSRYGSRVEAMRGWLVGDLKALINGGDFVGLKEATGKKGVATSYLSALDLWAASYSDASLSEKTLSMQKDVADMRTAIAELNVLAKKALGEDVQKSGGLFGFGAKEEEVPKGVAMAKLLAEVAAKAKASYNDYCVVNNVGHPFEVDELVEI